MKICPLTGKPCYHDKIFQITDLENGKVSKELRVCHECVGECVKDKEETLIEIEPDEIELEEIELEEIDLVEEFDLSELEPDIEVELTEMAEDSDITPSEALKNIVEFIEYITDPNVSIKDTVKSDKPACPQCKCTLDDIGRNGRIGCAMCYTFFEKQIMRVIKYTQDAEKHTGKKPKIFDPKYLKKLEKECLEEAEAAIEKAVKKLPLDVRIKKLKAEMKRFVNSEEYEKAADIRDEMAKLQHRFTQIKKLKSELRRAVKDENNEKTDDLKKEIEKLENEDE
jgi:protein-arginine kinase activator protein McsA